MVTLSVYRKIGGGRPTMYKVRNGANLEVSALYEVWCRVFSSTKAAYDWLREQEFEKPVNPDDAEAFGIKVKEVSSAFVVGDISNIQFGRLLEWAAERGLTVHPFGHSGLAEIGYRLW
jgi:hypothetical protein